MKNTQLDEGQWRPSGVGDLWVRVNPPKPQMNRPANAHVAHKKHLNAKNKQVSWEAEAGKKHDRLTFDANFTPMEKAKQVARSELKLPDDFVLEEYRNSKQASLLLESTAELPPNAVFLCVQQSG